MSDMAFSPATSSLPTNSPPQQGPPGNAAGLGVKAPRGRHTRARNRVRSLGEVMHGGTIAPDLTTKLVLLVSHAHSKGVDAGGMPTNPNTSQRSPADTATK